MVCVEYVVSNPCQEDSPSKTRIVYLQALPLILETNLGVI